MPISLIPRFRPMLDFRDINNIFSAECKHEAVKEFEEKFAQQYGFRHAIAFSYARMGFYTFLKVIQPRSKTIILPAFTCVVMADAASLCGFDIQFIDVDKNLLAPAANIMTVQNEKAGVLALTDMFGNTITDEDSIKKELHDHYLLKLKNNPSIELIP